ncbi:class I SAM-dependent methyltransferase [Caldibacillus thermolactis]|uniref:S-adenosyl-L-methionine-dependent methyltransferase n=1 Tax=Pallidibacillus thermolactis TaxID=251051 RepID=A0ABT2WJN9_9BACI|nr:class I SAM-dependent methyltransferase [Pallidibacillus thermolactis]MCU9595890.1 class I SAM-dependent methyltransferase [Pallidibacillus thermolactis]MCU9602777.1 class I SAM-dependent methyltransferase [Pallidibacillus thermolactis subsp. kokeshiiformis]MED1675057.1 class I SAM-dependent methyltransferase [Pallidibacillus thermolactis subsp. kokeshiiformis]
MKQNKSSMTALISAFSRAYHSQNDLPIIFDDFLAKDLLSQKELSDIKKNMINSIQFFNKDIAEKFKDQPDEILKWITQVQLSPTPLARAAFCEQVLLNEVNLGLEQYVILGAGYDTFCFRHLELENKLEIFELDHPSTQELKRKRITDAGWEIPNHLHFVPMDFTKNFIYQRLKENGFDENKKTFISLLGVTYYLTKEENINLIKNLFAKVPSGSSIVFDYADETLFEEKGKSNRVENMVKLAFASREPMKSSFAYHELESILEQSGLLIFEHLSPTMINNLYFQNRTDYLSAFETIHYIHAVKR